MATMCGGFVGLVVDAGAANVRIRQDQTAADSAALAAAYKIFSGGTIAQATTAAQQAATLNGCASPCTINTPLYLIAPSSNTTTTTTTLNLIDHVLVTYTDTSAKTFTKLLSPGSTTVPLSVTAAAQVTAPGSGGGGGSSATLTCSLCLLNTSPPTVYDIGISTGPYTITGSGTIISNAGLSVTGSGVNLSNFGLNYFGSMNTPGTSYTPPTPIVHLGSAIADPLAAITMPPMTGTNFGAWNNGGASQSLSPGVYDSITTSGTSTLTFAAGVYVIANASLGVGLNLAGTQTLNGTGVTFYFVCGTAAAPRACVAENGAGASITSTTSRFNLKAPTTGSQNNLLWVFDRGNKNTFSIPGNGSATDTGAFYGKVATVSMTGTSTSGVVAGPIVADHISVTGGAGFDVNGSLTVSGVSAAPSVPGSLVQ
jgi:hypothetical protein